MRKGMWIVGLFLAAGLAGSARAQQVQGLNNAPSFLSNFFNSGPTLPQPVNVSQNLSAPPPPVVQQSSAFSLAGIKNLFSKIPLPSFPPAIFSRNQSPGPVLPGQQPDAIYPLPPVTQLPAPQYPDAFKPLPPIYPNQ